MISWDMARALEAAGLAWSPASGDRFRLRTLGPSGEVYTVSDMTVEPHVFDTGVILGFNGTTEWALDSVALEDTLWHPREDQLRSALGQAFQHLEHTPPGYIVTIGTPIGPESFAAGSAEDAYAAALLRRLERERPIGDTGASPA